MAQYLEVTPRTKYMAILLFEEFLHKYFRRVRTTVIPKALEEEEDLHKICNEIASKLKIYLLSCFQLACKADSVCTKIEIWEVRQHIL